VRQNPIQRTVNLFICVCIALCTIVAHNIAQNRPDSFPPYPPHNHHISDDVYLREGGYVPPRTWKEEEMVVITVVRRCHRVNNFGRVRSAWPSFSQRIYRSTGSCRQRPAEILFLSVVYNLIRCECFLICNLRCCVIELLNVAWNYCQVTFGDQVVGWKL